MQLENVTITAKANVYFDGKCVSHTIINAAGERKSVGVILPSTLTFGTAAAEVMQLIEGECSVTLAGEPIAKRYVGGESFAVAQNSSFVIEAHTAVHYICHFA